MPCPTVIALTPRARPVCLGTHSGRPHQPWEDLQERLLSGKKRHPYSGAIAQAWCCASTGPYLQLGKFPKSAKWHILNKLKNTHTHTSTKKGLKWDKSQALRTAAEAIPSGRGMNLCSKPELRAPARGRRGGSGDGDGGGGGGCLERSNFKSWFCHSWEGCP